MVDLVGRSSAAVAAPAVPLEDLAPQPGPALRQVNGSARHSHERGRSVTQRAPTLTPGTHFVRARQQIREALAEAGVAETLDELASKVLA